MKLYVYHLPDFGTMWAFIADSDETAMGILANNPEVRADLVRVLAANGDGLLFQIPDSDSVIAETDKQ